MRIVVRIVLSFVLYCSAQSIAMANEYQDANRAYSEGEYSSAIAAYETLIGEGVVHEDLFYNLGNAYFRAGRMGPSIYSYERALRIRPHLEDALFNLNLARDVVAESVQDRVVGANAEPFWVRVSLLLSKKELRLIFLATNFFLFTVLSIRFFLPRGFYRSLTSFLVMLLGVGWLASGILLNRHIEVVEKRHQAVVLSDQVFLREAPTARSAERGQLHPGLLVQILDRENKWSHVRLSNGVEGWLPMTSIGEL